MMKGEDLIDVLGFLDDELIIEAGKKRVDRRKIIYFRTITAVAACLAVFVMSALILRTNTVEPVKDNPAIEKNEVKWKHFRRNKDDLFVKVDEKKGPQVSDQELALATEVPGATKIPSNTVTKAPTNKPVVTKIPDSTKTPAITSDSPTVVVTPVNPTEAVTPGITEKPSVTAEPVITATPAADDWTSHLVADNTVWGEGYYGVDYEFVQDWFGSALDMAPMAPVMTPNPLPDTPIPGEDASPPEPTMTPSVDNSASEDEEWDYYIEGDTLCFQWMKKIVSSENIDSFYRVGTLKGIGPKQQVKKKDVNVYEIKDISPYAVFATTLPDDSNYYMFYNTSFVAAYFTEYLQAYNLREFLVWDTLALYDKGVISTGISSDKIWEILEKTDGIKVDEKNVYENYTLVAALGMDIDFYGYQDIPMAIYEEGYVIINLFGKPVAYRIGEAAVAEIRALLG